MVHALQRALRLGRRGKRDPRLSARSPVLLPEHDAARQNVEPREEAQHVVDCRPERQTPHAQRAGLARRAPSCGARDGGRRHGLHRLLHAAVRRRAASRRAHVARRLAVRALLHGPIHPVLRVAGGHAGLHLDVVVHVAPHELLERLDHLGPANAEELHVPAAHVLAVLGHGALPVFRTAKLHIGLARRLLALVEHEMDAVERHAEPSEKFQDVVACYLERQPAHLHH
mmetsp:Transcript_32506/g.104998  ORF Transcript_32506/g.104998 Transcript_32506/m.104998 type:complete len:228 (-) Transcript_32506:173-856(-)